MKGNIYMAIICLVTSPLILVGGGAWLVYTGVLMGWNALDALAKEMLT